MSDTDEPVRIAVIAGTGTAAKRVLPALASSRQVSICAMHGRSQEKLAAISTAYPEVATFTDIDEMLSTAEPDAVLVASPPMLHIDHCIQAFRYVSHVLCEKPLADDLRDGEALAELAAVDGRTLAIAHHLRHQQAATFLRSLVAQGSLGPAIAASARWTFALNKASSNAAWKLASSGAGIGPLLDTGVHCVDMAEYLFGRPAEAARLASESGLTGNLVMRFESGPLVDVTASWEAAATANDLSIVFERGSVLARGFFAEKSCPAITVTGPEGELQKTFGEENLYRNELEAFAASVRGQADGREPLTTAEEALAALRAIL
ncbi:Gfo/Idh/MocA family oxidoreductase [Catenulispora subtropica]|uniref:Gfo/Idh/MocA family oxidoreductase n=1 Tax=Catenulispora subtropica TaxID=450798 RepID=A0ABP5DRQ5_9ACTN